MMNFLRKQMKWVMGIIVVAFLLSTFLMYEGRGTRRSPGRNPDGTMTDYEVAKINGRSLMRSELERRLRDYLSNYSSRSAESLDMPAIYQAVLDQAVLEAQLAKAVEEQGIRVSDADAERAMKDYADRYYPTRETFYQALANSGVKVEDYKRSLARQMATEQVIRNAIGEVEISEDRAVEFYDTMKAFVYTTQEGYMLHMADFRTNGDAEFMRSLLEAGQTWEEIVSKDELASHDVINVTREPVFLPTSAFNVGTLSALASLDIGQVSPVFMVTSFDYAVGLKTEHRDAEVKTYEEVSGDIKTMLTNQEERRRLNAFERGLKESAQLVINDQELFAIPDVSGDVVRAHEDLIPELAELESVSESEPATEAEATSTENEPATENQTIEAETVTETPAVESEPETPSTESEPFAETETPTTDTEATPATETPATEPETATETPSTENETVSETEATATESEPATETPATESEPATEPETTTTETEPVTETTSTETEPATETPAVESEPTTEPETPAEETQPVSEPQTQPVTEEVITESQDIPLQQVVDTVIDEAVQILSEEITSQE